VTASLDPPPSATRAADGGVTSATPVAQLVPAILLSTLGFFVAVNTPMQLLLTLRLTAIAHDTDATTAFGMVTGFGALVAILANPVAGRLSDRTTWLLGRRRTWIITGALSGSLVLVALGSATEVWQVVALWCLVQATLNLQFAATNALMADQVPPSRRGLVSGLGGVTVAIGPLLGITVVSAAPAGGALQWQIVAGILVVTAVLAAALIRDTGAPRAGRGPRRGIRDVAAMFWIDPRRHPAFGWAWLVRFLITSAYASTTYSTFFLLQRFGIPTDEVGGVVLGTSLITVTTLVCGSLGAGILSDRLARQKLAAVGLLMMSFAPSLGWIYASSAVLGLGVGSFFAVDQALCIRVLPSAADVGKDFAIINIANSLPQSLVPLVAPLLLAVGGYAALFGTLSLFGALGAVAVLRVPEVGQEHGASPRVAPITRPVPTILPRSDRARTEKDER
jgi:MFS family permease